MAQPTTTLSLMIGSPILPPTGSRDASPVASAGWANFAGLNHNRQNGYLVAWCFGSRTCVGAESQIVQYW